MYFRLLNIFLFSNLAFFHSAQSQVSVVPPVTAIRPVTAIPPVAAITVSPVSALPPVTANKVCAANPAGENECFNYIKELAEKDQCLASRLDRKKTIAQSTSISGYYTQQMLKNNKCSGKSSLCGNTMSWVSEVFEGISNQFDEIKNDDGLNGQNAGYELAIGREVFKTFEKNKNSPCPIIYKMRHTGTEDHVWLIEQLPRGQGYRIYQSYNDAYTLKAWLSTSLDGLFASNDIKVFKLLKAQVDSVLQAQFPGLTINSPFELLPLPDNLKKYLIYVRDYNEKNATEIFRRAWEVYGKGQVIDYNKLSNFIQGCSEISTFMNAYDNTDKPMSESVWKKWTDLYAAPNPLNFPNLASNFISSNVFKGRVYRFEVKTQLLDNPSACQLNAFNIKQSL